MSDYRVPDPVYKRRSFQAPDFGLLFNLTKRIFPMMFVILVIIVVSVGLAYSLNSRAIPRQFVVGMCITFSILTVLWIILATIRCCRPKFAGKYNLRLDSPDAEPIQVPEAAAPMWDNIPPSFFDRPKQAPAVARRGRESAGIIDLCDRLKHVFKNWRDEPHWQYRDSMQARAPVQAFREQDIPGGRHAQRGQFDRGRDEMTESEAEDLYRRQRERDYRAARDDARRAHHAFYESDEYRSQDSFNMEVEPPQLVVRQNIHHFKTSTGQLGRAIDNANEVHLKLPDRAHNPRRWGGERRGAVWLAVAKTAH
ncbi:hypothetical protein V492_02678 [Pseudogymnoascus sp. VKM F-4246]|nr:hypothetical protein V492_02678 [Pseudogymnoascus sp. VKM F-4246]